MEIRLSCGSEIDERNAQYGENLSPSISFSGVPEDVDSLVVIMVDLNASETREVHWVAWNISPNQDLPEGVPRGERPGIGNMAQGNNDYGILGYQGPQYPPGNETYLFTVYALESELNLMPGSTREDVRQAMAGKVVDKVTARAGYTQ